MKIVISSLLILFSCFSFSQNISKNYKDFGRGTIIVRLYAHSLEDTSEGNKDKLLNKFQIQTIPYNVNTNIIIRDIPIMFQDKSKGIDSNAFKVSMTNLNYFIRYDSSLLYLYVYKNKKIDKIIRYGLDTCKFEYFYRPIILDSSRLANISLTDNQTHLINNIPCFEGEASEAKSGKKVIFYYTKKDMKVKSPLNNYFGNQFPGNIIRIKFNVDWTDKGTIVRNGGYIIFQIEGYSDEVQDDKLFMLPSGIPIVDNLPIEQAIRENQMDN